MKFSRITENQAYARIVEATSLLHEKGIECKEISEHTEFRQLGLNLQRCTTSGYGLSGEGEYSALFVTDGEKKYRVISVYIDTMSPKDTSIDDISESLGVCDPCHNQCDIRNHVAMSILYYMELYGEIPTKYSRHKDHS